MTVATTVWLAIALNIAISALFMLRPWRRAPAAPNAIRITLGDAVRPFFLGGASVALIRLIGVHLNGFGFIRLVYLHLVVLAPAMGLLVLAAIVWRHDGQRKYLVSRAVKLLAALTLVGIPIGVYATFIEPLRLKLETAAVPLRPGRDAGDEIRIAVLADIQTNHVGEHEYRAVELALAQRPDIVLLPGDFWQSELQPTPEDLAALRSLLNRPDVPGGVWLVQGNCDQPSRIEELCRGTPATFLYNRIVRMRVRGRQVTIGGVELEPGAASTAVIRELETAPGEDDIRILLGHYPDNALRLRPDSRVDLVVAGHTHGGQIVVPGFGPLMTLTGVPRRVAAGGLHRLSGNAIYVSRGVGCERGQAPRIRFWCPPEVSLLTFAGTVAPPTASTPAAATAPTTTQTTARQPLTVLTWNIQGCARGLEPMLADLRHHDADVLCLQEVEAGTAHTDGADQATLLAKELGRHEFSAGSAFASGQGEQRMTILTRQPLERTEALDAGTGRIYGVTGVFRADGRAVRIVCVHLTNRYWRGVKAALNADNAPALEATDLARRLKDWPEPVIVAGDFNAVPSMRELRVLSERVRRVPATQPTFPADQPTLAVDHIFGSAHCALERFTVIASKASDHLPVRAEFHLDASD